MELVSVADGHTNEFSDDRRRYRQRIPLDQIHTLVRRDVVQQLVRDNNDAIVQALNNARRERLVHQHPQPGVIGRVGIEHVSRQRLKHFGRPRESGFLGAWHVPTILHESGIPLRR